MWDEEIDPRINVRADAEFIAAAVNAVRRMLAREVRRATPLTSDAATLCPYCSADTGDGSACARCSPGG